MSRLYVYKPHKDKVLYPVSRFLRSVRITPNMVTTAGLLLSVMAGMIASSGHLYAAIIIFMIGAGLDAVDGSLARMSGHTSEFGRYFDSICDRLSETVFIAGAVISGVPSMAFLVVIGSVLLLVSRILNHLKGCNSDIAMFGRPERLVLLVAGLLAPFPVNIILFGSNALLSIVSSIQILSQRVKTTICSEYPINGEIL